MVAHEDLDRVARGVYLHLQRPFLGFVCVQDDVVACLGDRCADVVQIGSLQANRLGHSSQRLSHQHDVLGPVGEIQTNVR